MAAKDNSFDIVSETDLQEVNNAINQTTKEIQQRYDFKGSKSTVTLNDNKITVIGDDEFKLKSVIDILQNKLVKRNVSLKCLDYGKEEFASGDTIRQVITLKQGIAKEKAKEITKIIKESKLKVQAQYQDDQVRVSGKSKDDLQAVINLLKGQDFDIELQFINFR